MQIHELNTFVGTPSATDYLAIDDGTETNKVPATALGVSTQMTQAEAEAGTVTAPRVVSPSVFKASVESLAETVAETVAEKREVVVVAITSFSSLPKTVNDSNITSGMVVINAVFGNPSAQIGDWTATTSNGSVTLTGTISGSTTLTLYLMKSKSGTSTSTIKGSNIYHFSKSVTIGANAVVTVDMSDVIPSGKSIKGIVTATYGGYNLPYIEGTTFTYIYHIYATSLQISSTTSSWGARTFEGYLIAE